LSKSLQDTIVQITAIMQLELVLQPLEQLQLEVLERFQLLVLEQLVLLELQRRNPVDHSQCCYHMSCSLVLERCMCCNKHASRALDGSVCDGSVLACSSCDG
jgi:hypothetical protein